MLRNVSTLLAALILLLPARDLFASEVVYRWTDASGALHFSDGGGGVPTGATVSPLPSLSTISTASTVGPRPDRRVRRPAPEGRSDRQASCGLPDATGLAGAVARRLGETGQLAGLALFVGNEPVAYGADAVVRVYRPEQYPELWTPVENGVPVAYPAAAACPSRPPAVRLPVLSSRPGGERTLCDDYRRAFAEVGVAVNRNAGVAEPFREIAERFVGIAVQGYQARGLGYDVGLTFERPEVIPVMQGFDRPVPQRAVMSPWTVDAHITQLTELARETQDYIDELTVALEEIDRAARARGCW